MESTRFSQCPSDLTTLLVHYLPWETFNTVYTHLPEFSKYDLDHPIWKQLYLVHLSTYPAPSKELRPDVNDDYRAQYLWGRRELDAKAGSQLRPMIDWLVMMGYDVALIRYLRDHPLISVSEWMVRAARDGFLSIIQILIQTEVPVLTDLPNHHELLDLLHVAASVAAEYNRPSILDYITGLLGWTETWTQSILNGAAEGGNLDLAHHVMAVARQNHWTTNYYETLTHAVHGTSVELVQELMALCPGSSQPHQVRTLLNDSWHVNVSLHLMQLLPDVNPEDMNHLLDVSIDDDDLYHLNYAHQHGGQVTDGTYASAVVSPKPNIHRWLIQHDTEKHFANRLGELIAVLDDDPSWIPRGTPGMGSISENLSVALGYLDALDRPVANSSALSEAVKTKNHTLIERVYYHPHIEATMGWTSGRVLAELSLDQAFPRPLLYGLIDRLRSPKRRLRVMMGLTGEDLKHLLSKYQLTAADYVALLRQHPDSPEQTAIRNAIPPALLSDVEALL